MHRSHDLHDTATGFTATVFVVDPDPATGGVVREALEGSGLDCEFAIFLRPTTTLGPAVSCSSSGFPI